MTDFCEECGSKIGGDGLCSKQLCTIEKRIKGFESKPKRKTRWERKKKQ